MTGSERSWQAHNPALCNSNNINNDTTNHVVVDIEMVIAILATLKISDWLTDNNNIHHKNWSVAVWVTNCFFLLASVGLVEPLNTDPCSHCPLRQNPRISLVKPFVSAEPWLKKTDPRSQCPPGSISVSLLAMQQHGEELRCVVVMVMVCNLGGSFRCIFTSI